MSDTEDVEPDDEPLYYECNSCGEEFEDGTGECCDDGEIVPHNDI